MKDLLRDRSFISLFSIFLTVKTAIIFYAQMRLPYSWIGHLYTDLWSWLNFFHKSQEGLIPYVDFSREYPVGAGLLYWLMSFFIPPGMPQKAPLVHSIFMLVAEAIGFILFYKIAQKISPKRVFWATVLFGFFPTALILGPVRFESYVTLSVLAGFLFHLRGKPRLATLCWALGCSMKWYPLFFIAARDLRAYANNGKKCPLLESAAITGAVLAAINLPFILFSLIKNGNIENWWQTYAFHINRPLYWDTLLGVGQLWWGTFSFEVYAGYWTLGLVLLALFVRPRMPVEAKGVLICIAAIIFNRVYSTQFHLWFYPFLILFMMRQNQEQWARFIIVLVVLDFLNVFVYPFSFAQAYAEMGNFGYLAAHARGGPWTVFFSLAIFVRTLMLGAVVWMVYSAADGEGAREG